MFVYIRRDVEVGQIFDQMAANRIHFFTFLKSVFSTLWLGESKCSNLMLKVTDFSRFNYLWVTLDIFSRVGLDIDSLLYLGLSVSHPNRSDWSKMERSISFVTENIPKTHLKKWQICHTLGQFCHPCFILSDHDTADWQTTITSMCSFHQDHYPHAHIPVNGLCWLD